MHVEQLMTVEIQRDTMCDRAKVGRGRLAGLTDRCSPKLKT